MTAKIVAGIVGRFREHGVRHRIVEFEGGHEMDEAILGALADE